MEQPLIVDRKMEPRSPRSSSIRKGVAWWPASETATRNFKTVRELRKFAIVVSSPLLLIGGYLAWRNRTTGYIFLGAATTLLALAVIAPGALAPVERTWMKVAGWMSVVMTYIILTLTFFLVITPVGWIVRHLGHSGITFRPDPNRTTYWEPVEPEGPATRPDRPY